MVRMRMVAALTSEEGEALVMATTKTTATATTRRRKKKAVVGRSSLSLHSVGTRTKQMRKVEGKVAVTTTTTTTTVAATSTEASRGGETASSSSPAPVTTTVTTATEGSSPWAENGRYYKGLIVGICAVAFAVGASGASTIAVVFTAQIVNGFLLPCVSTCLLVCLNDESLMRSRPMNALESGAIFATTAACIFLAAHTIVSTTAGGGDDREGAVTAGAAAATVAALVPIVVYLRRQNAAKESQPYSTMAE
mmetsp:Transcript_57485/g.108171  ORF Transcript_57485/g.108171 Transcript_57485/m.108171 type:complete len:251 (+) Transcript_57485:392-1144(+)